MPIAAAAIGWSRIAMIARPVRLLHQVGGAGEHDQQYRQREVIEPLVGVERQAGRRIGLHDDDALHAAGQRFERLEFQDLRHRDRQREGRQRQIEALQPQRRQAEQKADDKADPAGAGNVQ